MGTPAFLDPALSLPAGGVNGFELNGNAVNGVGFVDNPFLSIEFVLDPDRVFAPSDRNDADIQGILAALVPFKATYSVHPSDVQQSAIQSQADPVPVVSTRNDSALVDEIPPMAYPVEAQTCVPWEVRSSVVTQASVPLVSDDRVESVSVSQGVPLVFEEVEASQVPAEDRTTIVPRNLT